MRTLFSACLLLLGALLLRVDILLADEVSFLGESYHEVLKKLGPPLEKTEYEIKREAIWLYPEGRKITFHNSTVINDSQESNEEPREVIALEAPESQEKEEITIAKTPPKNTEYSFSGTDVFREIAKLEPEEETKKPTLPKVGRNRKK